MKSPTHRRNKRQTTQRVTVINDTKYTSKLAERTIPTKYYTRNNGLKQENTNHFLSLCGIACLYIFLILAIMIGGGGIAVCAVYYNSAENTQYWKIGGIVLGVVTCIVSVILVIISILKQTRNRPWRYRAKDILLHPDNYLTDNGDQYSSEELDDDDKFQDDINKHKHQTVDTTLPSVPSVPKTSYSLLKTVHNNLVYCLGCNHLHSASDECINPKRTSLSLPPLDRSKSYHIRRDSNDIEKTDTFLKKAKSHAIINRPVNYSLSNETQTDILGNTTENLVLKPVPIPAATGIVRQPTTNIMIVRVPNVAGKLVIQSKEH